jgi:hypothetical protein
VCNRIMRAPLVRQLRHAVRLVAAMGALAAAGRPQPASLLAHTAHWWSVENLFQRAVFLSEVAH